MSDNYLLFSRSFDKAYRGEITISELEKDADRYCIAFDCFCNTNEFEDCESWADCINAYSDQLKE